MVDQPDRRTPFRWQYHAISMDAADLSSRVGVIVAHPDDETLWAGGVLLMHPNWLCRVATLCRAGDRDRAPKFARALAELGATGAMENLDDEPEQLPMPDALVRDKVMVLMGDAAFDLLITHGPRGEYIRHRRHEETCRAVVGLWQSGQLSAKALWMFAYEDGGGAYLPLPRTNADLTVSLPPTILQMKYRIIHEIYGFSDNSWEAQATPAIEAFYSFTSPEEAVAAITRVD